MIVRHEKAELLLRIAFDMQATREGLTLEDIASGYGERRLSRRTAERLRDAIARLFPGHFEEVAPGRLPKRWRLRRSWLSGLGHADRDGLAALQRASELLRGQGEGPAAEALDRLQAQLRATQADSGWNGDEDVEALAVEEGIAVRVHAELGDPQILSALRRAIRQGRQVELRYRVGHNSSRQALRLHPYGLLFGSRHHLVGSVKPGGPPRLYALASIEAVSLLPDALAQPEDFVLKTYAAQPGAMIEASETAETA